MRDARYAMARHPLGCRQGRSSDASDGTSWAGAVPPARLHARSAAARLASRRDLSSHPVTPAPAPPCWPCCAATCPHVWAPPAPAFGSLAWRTAHPAPLQSPAPLCGLFWGGPGCSCPAGVHWRAAGGQVRANGGRLGWGKRRRIRRQEMDADAIEPARSVLGSLSWDAKSLLRARAVDMRGYLSFSGALWHRTQSGVEEGGSRRGQCGAARATRLRGHDTRPSVRRGRAVSRQPPGLLTAAGGAYRRPLSSRGACPGWVR